MSSPPLLPIYSADVLQRSGAGRELRRLVRVKVGLDGSGGAVDLETLLGLHLPASAAVGSSLAIEEHALQKAMASEFENLFNRAIQQTVSYLESSRSLKDPAWTFVAGYYSAFHAARAVALLGDSVVSQVGDPVNGERKVLIELGSLDTSGRRELNIAALPPASHRESWRRCRDVLSELIKAEHGTSEFLALRALHDRIHNPTWLSDYRNRANYDLIAPADVRAAWPSVFKSVRSVSDLERLLVSPNPSNPQRLDSVILGLLLLLGTVHDYRIHSGVRVDRRPSTQRKTALEDGLAEVPEFLDGLVSGFS